MPPRKRPDISAIAAENPPPALTGRAALFAVQPAQASGPTVETPPRPAAQEPAALAPAAEPRTAGPKHRPRIARSRSPRATDKPISREADTPSPRGSDVQVERSYVLDIEHDRMLHEMAVVTGLPVKAVLQEALAGLLEQYEGQDLRRAAKSPFEAGPEPAMPVRRTVSIRQEQDRLLRSSRMLFRVQASDVVRQAIAQHYEVVCGDS